MAGCRVGILRLRSSARRAITASTESAALRPARRAVSFSSTIASAVCCDTFSFSSARSNCASDTNGTSAESFVSAWR
jgi:hypothetical protein